MLIRVAEQLVTHASVESTLEVGDIRCTCSVGRQRVPQWNATNREAALSQICRNDGGKHLVTVPSGSAMGRTLEQVTGRYARSIVCGSSAMSAGRPVPLFFSHTSYNLMSHKSLRNIVS